MRGSVRASRPSGGPDERGAPDRAGRRGAGGGAAAPGRLRRGRQPAAPSRGPVADGAAVLSPLAVVPLGEVNPVLAADNHGSGRRTVILQSGVPTSAEI